MLNACSNSSAENKPVTDTIVLKQQLIGTWDVVVPDSAAILAEGDANFIFDKNTGTAYTRFGKDYGQVTDTSTLAFTDKFKWKFGKATDKGATIITTNKNRKITEATGMYSDEGVLTDIMGGFQTTDTIHLYFKTIDTLVVFDPQDTTRQFKLARKK